MRITSASGLTIFRQDRQSRIGAGLAVAADPRDPVSMREIGAVGDPDIGTLRRERIDHVLIHGERHLRTVQAEFESHCNHHRPHRSRPFHPPYTTQAGPIDLTAPINHRTTVSGLVNEYRRAA